MSARELGLVTGHRADLAAERGALRDLAKTHDARIAQQVRANEETVALPAKRDAMEPDLMSPGRRSEADVGLVASHGADHLAMGREHRRARVKRQRVEALLAGLPVEVGPDAGRLGSARESPATELPQASHANAAPHDEPHLSLDEVNEREPLPVEGARDLVAVTAGHEDFPSPEKIERLASIRLNEAHRGARPGVHAREQALDRNVSVGGEKGRRVVHPRAGRRTACPRPRRRKRAPTRPQAMSPGRAHRTSAGSPPRGISIHPRRDARADLVAAADRRASDAPGGRGPRRWW